MGWGERFLFAPNLSQKILAFFLLPLSALYCTIVFIKYLRNRSLVQEFDLPIISVGNLIVGGSGKTPLTIALAREYEKSAVILRGYGRASQGTLIVSDWGQIGVDVKQSGDEAMLLALSLPKALIIVSSDRIDGIRLAKSKGAELIWLDDAYSKHFISKLDLLLEPAKRNYLPFCLPAGPYREKLWWGKKALILQEERDFTRQVRIKEASEKMLLVTAISKPWRLDPFLPNGIVDKIYFPDHANFDKNTLVGLMEKYEATSLLVTEKDAVKLQDFDLSLSILELTLKVDGTITNHIDNFIKERQCNKK